MIYGAPQLEIVQDTTDLIGIRVIVLAQMWQPSTSEPIAALNEKPAAPAVPGGVILVGEQTLPSKGAMRTAWTFQGINGDGKGVTFKDRQHSIDYGFEPGFAQIPIQLHPDFKTLLDTYGGYAGNDGSGVIWDPDNTGPSSGAADTAWGRAQAQRGLIGLGSSTTGTKTNPMFGVQDYFRLEGTYRFRYAAKVLPGGFYDRSGTIVETAELPGEPPATSDGRNWLFVPPPFRRRGTILDVTEMYWLSGSQGWPVPVYGRKK